MKVLVTAGPTREFLDPVRYISNRSSGKMGYAIASAFVRAGHDVTLVSGPVCLPAPEGAKVERVISAADMLASVRSHLEECEVVVMSAAVADWRPRVVADEKIKKHGGSMVLEMEATEDILMSIKPLKGTRTFVGFAAETGAVGLEAKRKLTAKGLDMIVANDVLEPGAGFEYDTNKVIVFDRKGNRTDLPMMTKVDLATKLVKMIEAFRL